MQLFEVGEVTRKAQPVALTHVTAGLDPVDQVQRAFEQIEPVATKTCLVSTGLGVHTQHSIDFVALPKRDRLEQPR